MKIADICRDTEILIEARTQVLELLKNDPGLLDSEHANLRELYRRCPPFSEDFLVSG